MNFPRSEYLALQSLYESTSGPDWNWINYDQRWMFPTISTISSTTDLEDVNPCIWEGIACTCYNSSAVEQYHPFDREFVTYYYYYYDDVLSYVASNVSANSSYTCRIEKIFLIDHNLAGSLPDIFDSFTNLTHLHLARNHLTGTIPGQLFSPLLSDPELPNRLIVLDLCDNSLKGSISSSIAYMSYLEVLGLAFNKLTGSLPVTIGLLISIRVIYLNENDLSGPVPPSFGSLSRLEFLNLKSNALTGLLPSSFGDIGPQLTHLMVHANLLTATIPVSLSKLTNLEVLYLEQNLFTSTIPSYFGDLINLEILHVSYNYLEGTIPQSLSQLANLSLVGFRNNELTGMVPTYLFSMNLTYLAVSYNLFIPTTLPSGLASLTRLEVLHYAGVGVFGTLPSFLSTFQALEFLYLDQSSLSGTLPDFMGYFPKLIFMSLHQNLLTGTLPSTLGNLGKLRVLSLYENSLTGTMPSQFGRLSSLETLILSNNSFTGLISSSHFNATSQRQLATIDLSYNRLEGSLPATVFELPGLQTFVAGFNCFSKSTIPLPSICAATNLTELILDGIGLSPHCNNFKTIPNYFKSIFSSTSNQPDAYELTGGISNGIPSCLLGLPNLAVLHMSGNDLTGTIPSIFVTPSLHDLSLSHNVLTGTIPLTIQMRTQWEVLDLSFNRLKGTINNDIAISQNTALFLAVNRLSGPIPNSLHDITDISILSGNFFACSSRLISQSAELTSLPVNDEAKSSYQCGSDSLLTALVIYLSLLGFAIVLLVAIFTVNQRGMLTKNSKLPYLDTSKLVDMLGSWMSVFAADANDSTSAKSNRNSDAAAVRQLNDEDILIHFGILNRALRWDMMCLSLFSIFILMPIYTCFSNFSSSYTYTYAWVVSLTLVSGWVALTSVFSVLLLVMVYCYSLFSSLHTRNIIAIPSFIPNIVVSQYLLNHNWSAVLISWPDLRWLMLNYPLFRNDAVGCDDNSEAPDADNSLEDSSWYWRLIPGNVEVLFYSKMLLIGIFNLVVVVSINGVFVQATLTANPSALIAYSFLLSLFKVVWTDFVVPLFTSLAYQKRNKSDEAVLERDIHDAFTQTIVAVFNVIIIPCFVIAIVNPSCFQYIFLPPPMVVSNYEISYCDHFSAEKHPQLQATVTCHQESFFEDSISFPPPFQYSYECSAAVMISYSSVYVYFFLINAFARPVVWYLLLWGSMRSSRGSCCHRFLSFFLARKLKAIEDLVATPSDLSGILRDSVRSSLKMFRGNRRQQESRRSAVSWSSMYNHSISSLHPTSSGGESSNTPEDNGNYPKPSIGDSALDFGISPSLEVAQASTPDDGEQVRPEVNTIFNRCSFVVSTVQSISIISTFGFIYPPIAVIGAISICSGTLVDQLIVGRLYITAKQKKALQHAVQICQDCRGVDLILRQSLWAVYPMMSLFYFIFLFDMSASRSSTFTTNISHQTPAFIMLCIPLLICLIGLPQYKYCMHLLQMAYGAMLRTFASACQWGSSIGNLTVRSRQLQNESTTITV